MYDTTKPYTKKVLALIRKTWENDFCVVRDGIYPVVEMKHNLPTIDHTDGIGTKGHYHWNNKSLKAAAIDAFAMNFNDLVMAGATPIKMQNHLFLPEDNDEAVYQVVETLMWLSKKHNIVMTGGETSIHMNMNGMDLSITMTGVVHPKKDSVTLPNANNLYHVGDVLVGIPSFGLHSNGFTMVHDKLGGFRSEYVEPTRIYTEVASVYHKVRSLNHITGGAYTKIKPYLPKNTDAVFRFDQEPSKIFKDLYAAGLTSKEMYQTFNCGYGFVLGVPDENLTQVLKSTNGKVIGNVAEGTGNVYIQSAFDNKVVIY